MSACDAVPAGFASGRDEDNMVLLDKRDLFDAVRCAIKEAMLGSGSYADDGEVFGLATDAATDALRELVSKGAVPPAGEGLDANELFALRICAKLGYSTTPEVLLRLLDMVKPALPAGGVQFVGYPPVPEDRKLSPAGDVEVLAWMYQREGGEILGPLVAVESEGLKHKREGKRCEGRTILTPRADFFDWRPLVDRAQVTRLTAERDGLKYKAELYDEVWSLATGLGYMNVTTAITTLQSELTKARELLGRLERAGLRTKAQGIEVREFLAHQSAPAAKGGPRCNEERAELGLTTPPDCAACGRGSCFDR